MADKLFVTETRSFKNEHTGFMHDTIPEAYTAALASSAPGLGAIGAKVVIDKADLVCDLLTEYSLRMNANTAEGAAALARLEAAAKAEQDKPSGLPNDGDRRIVVEFIVPGSDPSAVQSEFVDELQDTLYDEGGLDGAFVVLSNEPYDPKIATIDRYGVWLRDEPDQPTLDMDLGDDYNKVISGLNLHRFGSTDLWVGGRHPRANTEHAGEAMIASLEVWAELYNNTSAAWPDADEAPGYCVVFYVHEGEAVAAEAEQWWRA